MIDDLKIIKKHYGELMMKFCRTHFSTLFEEPGLLPKLLLNNFEPNHSLQEDLDIYGKIGEFKKYIYSFVKGIKNVELEDDVEEEIESPEKLMYKAGYILY